MNENDQEKVHQQELKTIIKAIQRYAPDNLKFCIAHVNNYVSEDSGAGDLLYTVFLESFFKSIVIGIEFILSYKISFSNAENEENLVRFKIRACTDEIICILDEGNRNCNNNQIWTKGMKLECEKIFAENKVLLDDENQEIYYEFNCFDINEEISHRKLSEGIKNVLCAIIQLENLGMKQSLLNDLKDHGILTEENKDKWEDL